MAKKKNVKKNSFISYEFNNPFEFSTELALERSDISETWPKSTIREINKIKKEEVEAGISENKALNYGHNGLHFYKNLIVN